MTHLTIQQLVAQTDGALTGPSLALVEKHIAECETCWHEMERLAEQDALLASIITVDPGDAFFDDLAASVEAEISGKKKPAPRPVARPTPASAPAPVAIQRPEPVAALPAPEPEAVSPEPALPAPEPEATNPAPIPVAQFDAPSADTPAPMTIEPVGAWTPPAPGRLGGMAFEPGGSWTPPPPPAADPAPMTIEPVGAWSPPTPTPDDPFADLVFPPRSAIVSAPKPAPRPVVATPAPRPAARPAAKPAPKPVAAMPAPPAAPRPLAEPDPSYEPRRQPLAVPILIGVLAFIAGLAVAVVVVLRLIGPGGILNTRTEPSAPEAARTVSAPPASAAPSASTEPASSAVEPPAAPPALVVEPRPESSTVAPPVVQDPAPLARAAARPRLHAPPAASSAAENAALDARPTVVIPVRVIRSETMAPVSPPAPAPAPPAPASELGILCGAVRDGEGHPVARAQVMMADVGVVVLTDRAGRFCLTAPVGERTLSVVALGFTASRRLISLNKRTPELNLTLQPAAPFPTAR